MTPAEILYSRIKALYLAQKIDEAGLDSAVQKGWITAEQKTEIMPQ